MSPAGPAARPTSGAFRTLVGCCVLALASSSCGTLLFDHRHGQEDGRVDPNVLVMDGALLLLFILPGLVAYGVDIATGAIYLPPGVERGEGPFFE